MSIDHMSLVFKATGLKQQEKHVLLAFCDHTDVNGRAFAGEQRLMRYTGMSRSTFQEWKARLVRRNLLFSRRRGRSGGGRTTSDTYVNLELLRKMHDPFFDADGTGKPEDENPFNNTEQQVDGNGPEARAKGQEQWPGGSGLRGGNGPEARAINGPEARATKARLSGPRTLTNPQGEHTHTGTGSEEAVSAIEPETVTSVCVENPEAKTGKEPSQRAADALEGVLHHSAAKKLGKADRRALEGRIDSLFDAGWTTGQIKGRLDGTTDADTRIPAHPRGLLVTAIAAMENEEPPNSASSTKSADSWSDADGRDWPRLEPHQRPCRGMDCSDVSGNRYVSIDQPSLGPFSCPTCRKAYENGGMPGLSISDLDPEPVITDKARTAFGALAELVGSVV